MATLQADVPHSLGPEKATHRVRALIDSLTREHAGSIEQFAWDERTGAVRCIVHGITVSGSLRVTASAVRVELKLPLVALPFKTRIREHLVDALSTALADKT